MIKVNYYLIILIFVLIILSFLIFYYYRLYRKIRSILKYIDQKDKKVGIIPNSITEPKKINCNKLKETIEKYNSLTEESG